MDVEGTSASSYTPVRALLIETVLTRNTTAFYVGGNGSTAGVGLIATRCSVTDSTRGLYINGKNGTEAVFDGCIFSNVSTDFDRPNDGSNIATILTPGNNIMCGYSTLGFTPQAVDRK